MSHGDGGDGRTGWLDMTEQGSAAGAAALVAIATVLGRRPARALVKLLTVYYALGNPAVRRASRTYLERIHGRPASTASVYSHVLCFALCTLDRLFFVQGKVHLFDVESTGEEHLRKLIESRRGAILLGAHIGSFESMLRMADARDMRINIVGYFRNARIINATLERLNPRANARLIEVDPEGVDFVFRIRELIEKGELVAFLGDRVAHDRGRSVMIDFIGSPARLPTGPFMLAAALKCPVYLIFGLQRGGHNRYERFCEPFAESIELPRKGRERALRDVVQRYANRLEHYCRLAPDNWFNFFDFWEDEAVPHDARGQERATQQAAAVEEGAG